jgi:hypothetical protein
VHPPRITDLGRVTPSHAESPWPCGRARRRSGKTIATARSANRDTGLEDFFFIDVFFDFRRLAGFAGFWTLRSLESVLVLSLSLLPEELEEEEDFPHPSLLDDDPLLLLLLPPLEELEEEEDLPQPSSSVLDELDESLVSQPSSSFESSLESQPSLLPPELELELELEELLSEEDVDDVVLDPPHPSEVVSAGGSSSST